jgi:hypothetical protein
MARRAALLLSVAFASPLFAQTFDVVSVKRHPPSEN